MVVTWIDIGRHLAQQAFSKQYITYRELAAAVGWSHPTGRGLTSHLRELLNFSHEQGYPCLTSILVRTGTHSPPDDGIEYINQVYGVIDIKSEQDRVFTFDWSIVPELAFEQPTPPEINFDRIFATRTWGFDPENWGMTGFTNETTRNRILDDMAGEPIYVVYFCSPNAQPIEGHDGRFTTANGDLARVLGIVEVQPEVASHETHTSPEAINEMLELWGHQRWEYGLKNSRAWKFTHKPWTREALPDARSTSWEATRGIVPLSENEKRLVQQYSLQEVSVFGNELREIRYALREPMHTTYLAICDDPVVLQKAGAPSGTKLVKIGVSGNTTRRLSELNDHHFAKIFGLSFRMYATHRWPTQDKALGRETSALEWALENSTKPASGEFFFMNDSEISGALMIVKPPKVVR
jgi:hypothetical protein